MHSRVWPVRRLAPPISTNSETIQFGFRAEHHQFDLFAEFLRQVAHDTRQFRPRIADRLHTRLHDAFLQFRRDLIEALQWRRKLAVLLIAQNLQKLVARQHEFADHGHQAFKDVNVDPNALGRSAFVFR